MPSERRFRNDSTKANRFHKPDDGDDRMNENDEDVVHDGIVSNLKNSQNSGRFCNSPPTDSGSPGGFEVVLYELLAGRQLFVAPTVSDTLAGVLKSDLDAKAHPRKTTFEKNNSVYETFATALDLPSPRACQFFVSSTICSFICAGVGSAMWVATYHE